MCSRTLVRNGGCSSFSLGRVSRCFVTSFANHTAGFLRLFRSAVMPRRFLAARCCSGLSALGDSLGCWARPGNSLAGGARLRSVGCSNRLVIRSLHSLVVCRGVGCSSSFAVMFLVEPMRRRPPVLAVAVIVLGFLLFAIVIGLLVLLVERIRSILTPGQGCSQHNHKSENEKKSQSIHLRTPKVGFGQLA